MSHQGFPPPPPPNDKDEARCMQALFLVALLFGAARMVAGTPSNPALCFDDAESFLDEASRRGVKPEELL